MSFFKRSSKGAVSLFFATDIHGSELCFKKFIAAPGFYGAEVVVLGGDMTGKMIVPLNQESPGRFTATVAGRPVEVCGDDETKALEGRIRDSGFYPYRTDPDELRALGDDPEAVEAIFRTEMESTLFRWGEMVEEKFHGSDRFVFVAPGNDDPFFIDDILRAIPRFRLIEGEVVTVADRFEMLATGFSNRTPWKTHRELDEVEFAREDREVGRPARGSVVVDLQYPRSAF